VDASGQPATARRLILVIDDDDIVRRSLRRYLEYHDYNVVMAENGEEGLEIFKQRRDEIGLIVLDLSMPKMSGAEVLETIRSLDSGVGVVVVSGFATEKAALPGVDHVLQKPFEPDDLIAVVSRTLKS
jgi:two-component system cell cycle sensor histidine kinase/response regulator CckA